MRPTTVRWSSPTATALPVRLSDVGRRLDDSVEDLRNAGLVQRPAGRPADQVFRQPGANIIKTVDGIRAVLPQLPGFAAPRACTCPIAMDRTPTIRASLNDTQRTLVIAIFLVILVVFVFLRSGAPR